MSSKYLFRGIQKYPRNLPGYALSSWTWAWNSPFPGKPQTLHGMNPPQMSGNSKIFCNSYKKTLIQNTEKKQQLFPSLILPPHILQLPSGSSRNHFSSNWQCFDRLSSAPSDMQKWSTSQSCAWHCIVPGLVACSVHSTVVTASSLRRVLLRVLLRVSRRVQCA